MTKLAISKDLSLPLEFVTKTSGILAQRRKGKTYTASVIAEELVAAKAPFVVLDPTGAWWGLRASADGKSAGLPVVILGGQHGDVPLERTGGKFVAEMVIDEPGYYVIDFSLFESNEAERQFATDFAERIYRRKGQPNSDFAMHLIVDEADRFVPQRVPSGDQRMLGAFEAIVRRGGLRGLGTTLISQRAAVVNKNVLEQVDMLIVLRIVGPNDRKAILGYVQAHGSEDEVRELMDSLPSMRIGEAWIWEPGGDPAIFEKVQIRERRTFNSSATPKPGEHRVEPRQLADVDLEAIKAKMADTIERAKADDPKELRREIAALKKQLAVSQATKSAKADPVIQEVEVRVEVPVPVLDGEQLAAVIALQEQMEQVEHALTAAESTIGAVLAVTTPRREVRTPNPPRVVRSQGRPATEPRAAGASTPTRPSPAPPRGGEQPADPDFAVGKSEQKVLDGLAWLAAAGIEPASKQQVGWVAEYKPSGGRFNNLLGGLRGAGLISYPQQGMVALTDAGAAIAEDPGGAVTTMDLQQRILGMLPTSEGKVLQVVLDWHPDPVSKADLAQGSGYEPSGGRFNNILGRLRSLGLIDYPSAGWVEATDTLFVGGR